MYGIKNCNTVKKSIDWMNKENIIFEFMDVKKDILNEQVLRDWVENMTQEFTWEILLNKSGMSWRKLDETAKISAADQIAAFKIIINNPSIMKRPVIVKGKKIHTVGFNEQIFIKKFL